VLIWEVGRLSLVERKMGTTGYGRKKVTDIIKELMSSPKCRSVEVINNPARSGSNHRKVNCINYK
jgi:hypothetical protein